MLLFVCHVILIKCLQYSLFAYLTSLSFDDYNESLSHYRWLNSFETATSSSLDVSIEIKIYLGIKINIHKY